MAKRKKKNRKRKTSKSGKNRTPISGHKHIRGQLLPPFAKAMDAMGGKMQLSSWMNERLPEMLWAALIIASVDRDHALGQFRRILNFIGEHEQKEQFHDLTHTGIAKLDKTLRTELIRIIAVRPETFPALCTLRLFDALPGKEEWNQVLPLIEPDIDLLMDAVGNTLWHQTQEATDCRWVRVMAKVISGKMHFPKEMKEIANEWFKYPNEDDQHSVRPTIRAAEIALDMPKPPDLTWPKAFWEEAWANTPCIVLQQRHSQPSIDETVTVTRQAISELCERLEKHWSQTHLTTAIDPKHDAIFGMAFYCLRILNEMIGIGIGTSILGRLGLRTILEVIPIVRIKFV